MFMPTLSPRSTVPAGSVPMKLPSITLPPAASNPIAVPLKRLVTSPRTVLPPPLICSPFCSIELAPFNSISRTALSPFASVFGLAPGCV